MHETSRVSSAISVCDNYLSFISILLLAAIARWVRCWTTDQRVVLGESSRPLGDCAFTSFSNDLHLSFMLGIMDFSDIVILCNRPNCCQQDNKSYDQPLFTTGLFS